jgi:hypothetical protein
VVSLQKTPRRHEDGRFVKVMKLSVFANWLLLPQTEKQGLAIFLMISCKRKGSQVPQKCTPDL